MYGLDKATTRKRSEELLEFMQLADRSKSLIADYSHGMQKKLALAAAVIHGPRILFLDEPFEGVDALAAGALKELLARMTERGVTIFLTSHVLEIVEKLCTHVAIIKNGQLVAQGSLEQLRAGIASAEGRTLTLEDIFLSVIGAMASVLSSRTLMADLMVGPGLAEQIRLVSWLRWRVLRHSFRNKNRRLDLIGLVVSSFLEYFCYWDYRGIFIGTRSFSTITTNDSWDYCFSLFSSGGNCFRFCSRVSHRSFPFDHCCASR
jgi:hypothetical protein